MPKIAFNQCYGGFSLSGVAISRLKELGSPACIAKMARHDSLLIQVIEELGAAANGPHADIGLIDLPSGTQYRIDEYDGWESVETPDSYEWTIIP